MPDADAISGAGTWSPQAGAEHVGLGTRTLARLLRSKDVSLASASRRMRRGCRSVCSASSLNSLA